MRDPQPYGWGFFRIEHLKAGLYDGRARQKEAPMAVTFYGTAYVAAHMGVSHSSVTSWAKRDDFPQPAVRIVGSKDTVMARGWSKEQLLELRVWMSSRLGLTEEEAQSHWDKVDRDHASRRWASSHGAGPGQEMMDMGEIL